MSQPLKVSKFCEDSANYSSDDENSHYDESKQENMEEDSSENEINNEMSMEELLAMQEKIGTKKFSKKIMKSPQTFSKKTKQMEQSYKRANKNRPRELPLQRKLAPRMKYIDKEKPSLDKQSRRDPRFDDLSGKLDIIAWQKNYNFLKAKREKELKALKKAFWSEKDSEKKSRIKATIQRIENQSREAAKKSNERELKREERKNAISSLKEGRAPKYTSNKEKYLSMKISQFDQLKSDKKIEKYMQRKGKKRKFNKTFE